MTKNKRDDVVCKLKCWKGRTIVLYRSVLLGHVVRLHIDSAFVVEALKRSFNQPICVKKNARHATLNAFYRIKTGEQPYLLVAVKIQGTFGKLARPHFIKTFYGVDSIPPPPYEWENSHDRSN